MPRDSSTALRIGISACFMHADPLRPIFKGKTLLYLVEPMSDWLMGQGAFTYLIPSVPKGSKITFGDYVSDLDGLILQGGADVAPESYGEKPIRPEWSGDYVRDQYEITLVKEFLAQKKPILGICRGLQLLNVALGGTLYQDIALQVPGALIHRNWEIYDQNFHDISWAPGGYFENLYKNEVIKTVNSVHHQAVKDLAPDCTVEARAVPDGIIEAFKRRGDEYVVGVQWHPEFQSPADQTALLPTGPLLLDFLDEAYRAKKGKK